MYACVTEIQIKTEKPDDNQEMVVVEIGDLKFMSPIKPAIQQVIKEDYCGKG